MTLRKERGEKRANNDDVDFFVVWGGVGVGGGACQVAGNQSDPVSNSGPLPQNEYQENALRNTGRNRGRKGRNPHSWS